MKKALVVVMVLGAAMLSVPNAHAACGGSVPMFHGLDSYFICDNARGPVSAFAYQVAGPTVHNTGTEIIARDLGPGQVQISTDWGNPGIVGCPQLGTGNTRVLIVLQDNQGKGVLLSLSGADPGLGYIVETGHPFDAAGGAVLPITCGTDNGRPRVNSFTANTIDINVAAPRIFSDCDPDSTGVVGLGGSTCPDAFVGSQLSGIGRIFTSNQPCGTKPNTALAAWVLSTVQPDAAGHAIVPYTKPTDASCSYVGATLRVGGVEGSAINSFVAVAGALAAPPTAEGVRATSDTGKVRLSWSTSNEVGLASFRLIAVSKNKGQSEVGSLAAKGTPSSYTAEVRLGDLKGSRSIIIRSVLTDGTTVDAAPVNF